MSMLLIRKLRPPLTAALIAVASLSGASLLLRHLSAAPVPKEKEGSTPFVEWKYTEPCRELTSPVVCGSAVVVGTGDGVLRAFRAKDGEELWQYKHGQRIYHRPAADGERVYFSAGTDVTAVSAITGEQVWRFSIKPSSGPLLADAKLGLVFMGGDDGHLYALDAKTGEQKWTADFVTDAPADRPGFPGKDARINGTLARPGTLSSDGELLVLSVFDQSRVVTFDPKTGERKWAFQADGWVYGGAAITPTRVFVGSQDDHLHALDRETGKPLWKYKTKSRIECGPTADDTAVYAASCDGGLYAVTQKDGKKLWAFQADPEPDGKPSAIYSTPLLRRGALHFAAGEGQFYAVNAADGKLRWKVRPSEHSNLYTHPATDGTRFFITCRPKRDNNGEAALIAIGLK
jgi:outer membrane protein assembly factor BamB